MKKLIREWLSSPFFWLGVATGRSIVSAEWVTLGALVVAVILFITKCKSDSDY